MAAARASMMAFEASELDDLSDARRYLPAARTQLSDMKLCCMISRYIRGAVRLSYILVAYPLTYYGGRLLGVIVDQSSRRLKQYGV